MRIDELRTALNEHAETVSDLGVSERAEAVHQRVAGVRRRRRAVGVGIAIVALGVAAAVVPSVLRHPEVGPASRPDKLAGWVVPTTQDSLGYSYDYARGVQSAPGAKRLTVTVDMSGGPHLVTWASSTPGKRPTMLLKDNGSGGIRTTGVPGDFGSFAIVGPGQGVDHLTLTQSDAHADTRLGLAVYDLSSAKPAGVSNGTITFRQQVEGRVLQAGKIGSPGQSSVSFSWHVTTPTATLSEVCYGTNLSYRVYVAGVYTTSSSCADRATDAWDPGLSDTDTFAVGGRGRPHLAIGDDVTVRIRLVKGPHGARRATDPDAVLGLAMYSVPQGTTVSVAGTDIEKSLESDGHRYALASVARSLPGDRTLSVTVPASNRAVLVTAVMNSGTSSSSMFNFSVAGHPESGSGFENGTRHSVGWSSVVVQPAKRPTIVTLEVTRGLSPTTQMALVTSKLVN